MSKLTLSDVTNITGAETTALATLNANSALIETALENTFSRDGTSPNQMNSDLDMNEHDVMNVSNIEADTLSLGGVAVAASSLVAKGDKGDIGPTGPTGPAGTTSPVATTSVTGTVILGTFAQAQAGTPTGAYAPTLDVIKAVIDMICPVGTIGMFPFLIPPTYWLELNGNTIGDGSSSGTARANADTVNLFTVLWNNTTNAELSIQTSSGVPSTRGLTAAADFAAHKRLPLPDFRGQFVRGYDNGAGVDSSRALLSTQTDLVKAHTHTGTTDSQGNHTHSYGPSSARHGSNANDPGGFRPSDGDTDSGHQYTLTVSTSGAHTHTLSVNANTGTENRPINVATMFAIRY